MSVAMIRQQAKLLTWVVTIPLGLLVVLSVLLLGNVFWQGGRYADVVAVHYLPMMLYMWAIWMIRAALKAIADGALFDDVIPKLLFRIGLALFGGALFTVIGVPLASAALWGKPLIKAFEPSALTLGIVGAALIIFSRLFAQAATMRAEMDEFF